MYASEFLGPDHGHEEIDEQGQCNQSDSERSHGRLLQLPAELDVQPADGEERHHHRDVNEVVHDGINIAQEGARR
jgi:hypothetical protein